MKSIAIFFGGVSPEHEVSVITGLQVLANLDHAKYFVIPIYISKDGIWYTGDNLTNADVYKDLVKIPEYCNQVYFTPGEDGWVLCEKRKGFLKSEIRIKIDVIFPCFHGGAGEDGSFQGFFEVAKIPCVGSGVLGSALGMDKLSTKYILSANEINQAKFIPVTKESRETKIDFKYPMFVKPNSSGSSIGVSKVHNSKELKNAIDVALCFGGKAIVEEAIEQAHEINVSVVGGEIGELQVSPCEEVFSSSKFLSFDDKYKTDRKGAKGMESANRQIPAVLSPVIEKQIKDTACRVFRLLNLSGLARVDFLVKEKTREIFVLEANTIPGSYSFYLWKEAGVDFSQLCDKLIEIAEYDFANKKKYTTKFAGNLLSNLGSSLKNPKLG
ncbi:MAG: D-alanine--D-alanine ligase family protein [Patescibacteria group bacterium]